MWGQNVQSLAQILDMLGHMYPTYFDLKMFRSCVPTIFMSASNLSEIINIILRQRLVKIKDTAPISVFNADSKNVFKRFGKHFWESKFGISFSNKNREKLAD